MDESLKIWHLDNNAIDRRAWDNCVKEHFPELIYMQSWYLDTMVPGWEALVESGEAKGPYFSVMALPCRSKWNIFYLYQPYLTAQLGYVGPDNSRENLHRFLEAVPKKYRYWDFCMNERNPYPAEGYTIYPRNNRILVLDKDYPTIRENYSENCLRNLKKAEKSGCIAQEDSVLLPEALELYLTTTPFPPNAADRDRLEILVKEASSRGQLSVYVVHDTNDILIASCIFFWQGSRAYYLLPANTAAGKQIGASYKLVNGFIRDHAGKSNTLDFEGSDIESVERFYAGFGAIEKPYPAVKRNKLPFFLRVLSGKR